jgi:hypothetical protein
VAAFSNEMVPFWPTALGGLGEQMQAPVAHGTLQAEVEVHDHLVVVAGLVDLALGPQVAVEAPLEDLDRGTHRAAAAAAVHLGVLDHGNHLGAEGQDQEGPDVHHQVGEAAVVVADQADHGVRRQVVVAAAAAADRAVHDVRRQAAAAAAEEEEEDRVGHDHQVVVGVVVEQEDRGVHRQAAAVVAAVVRVAHVLHRQLVWEERVLARQQALL